MAGVLAVPADGIAVMWHIPRRWLVSMRSPRRGACWQRAYQAWRSSIETE
jgi:hypothetical protein